MMPDTRPRTGPAPAPDRLAVYTQFRSPAHTGPAPVHTTHTTATDIPGSAHPSVGQTVPPCSRVHTARFLVHMARWVAPTAGGALLIAGGIYTGPVSLIPAPVLCALAAVGWSVPVEGER